MSRIGRPTVAIAAAALAVACFIVAGRAGAAVTPSATMNPDSGLTNGEVVTVSGTGFPADQNVIVDECGGTITNPPTNDSTCYGGASDTSAYTDSNGSFVDSPTTGDGTAGFTVRVLSNSGTVNTSCGATDPCVLYVGVQLSNFAQPHVFLDLAFAPTAVATQGTTPTTINTATTPPTTSAAGTPTTVASTGSGSPLAASSAAGSASGTTPATAGGSVGAVDPTVVLASPGGQLAETGAGAGLLLLAGFGLLALSVGTAMSHLRRRPLARAT